MLRIHGDLQAGARRTGAKVNIPLQHPIDQATTDCVWNRLAVRAAMLSDARGDGICERRTIVASAARGSEMQIRL